MASSRYVVTTPSSFKKLRLHVLQNLILAEQGVCSSVIEVEAQLLETDEVAAKRGDTPTTETFRFEVDTLSPRADHWYLTVQTVDTHNWIQLTGDPKTDQVTFELRD